MINYYNHYNNSQRTEYKYQYDWVGNRLKVLKRKSMCQEVNWEKQT